jgi:hypothetical protein
MALPTLNVELIHNKAGLVYTAVRSTVFETQMKIFLCNETQQLTTPKCKHDLIYEDSTPRASAMKHFTLVINAALQQAIVFVTVRYFHTISLYYKNIRSVIEQCILNTNTRKQES